MKSHHAIPLNTITVPSAVAIRIEQIQVDCQHILDNDEVFNRSSRQLRSQYTSGVVPDHTFKSITQWLVGSALRRAGLPLNVAKCYAHLNPQCA
jgi:hypothetical protein